jgi:Raf kinase inhibitor-like YbhB/YbcL family protein
MKKIIAILSLSLIAGCAQITPLPPMAIQSSAFQNQTEIPVQYTCEGANQSPPLTWTNVPTDTKSLALIMDDPGIALSGIAPFNFVHWILYNLPNSATGLPEAVKSLPIGTGEGLNGMNATGYGGPCPPSGRHQYFHKLYALDIELPASLGKPTKAELIAIMQGHILATAELIGTYHKRH